MPHPKLTPELLSRLVAAAAAVAGQTGLTATLQTTVETARELTGAPYGALGVLGEHGYLKEFIHSGMDQGDAARLGPMPQGKGILGMITRLNKTVRIDRLDEHPDHAGFPTQHPFMKSFLGVPVRSGDHVFGNLYLANKEGGFTDEDEEVVESLAVIAGSAINTTRLNTRLRRAAVVEDRERISRDLHDAIIQDLFAVGLSLQQIARNVSDHDLRKSLEESVGHLDGAIASLRRFIFDLRPPVWAQRDLRLELADLVGQLASPHDVELRLSVEADTSRLPDALVEDAVQCVREAASNALRHSETSFLSVEVRDHDHQLTLTVVDGGKGFDVDRVPHGMGLDNLRTRATEAGGFASIVSEPGAGTTVRISLPIPR
jgi:signal transduction histidine kinase